VRPYRFAPRDLWRGSAARRAWAVAHALEASDVACVAPVAFVEWRLFGVPLRSALVVADELRADPQRAATPDELRARLREAGFDTRGLDAHGIALFERAGRSEARVIAPEQLRFPARRSGRRLTTSGPR